MVFSSAFFLFIFLPVTYIVYKLCRGIRLKNAVLIIASLFFYAFGEPLYVVLMLISIVANYLLALWIAGPAAGGGSDAGIREITDSGDVAIADTEIADLKGRKAPLAISVVFNIGLLVVFKYLGLILTTVNGITGAAIPVPELTLPIGISFYTFQALSYCVDVYRDRSVVQKKLSRVMLYISFFPQLIAGPIVKYHDIDRMLESRTETAEDTCEGIIRFIFGLTKKLLIANSCALIVDALYETPIDLAVTAWVFGILYCLQIYFDFSGYSDMAIGLGHIFGFTIKENFNYPYISDSIQEFWHRWHISLSTWFREYLYIPLGGNRKGKARTIINRFIVFLCTGIWHGANWTFLLWGVFHGVFLSLETAGIIRIRNRIVSHLYTLIVVITGFVIFRAESIGRAGHIIASMFTGFSAVGAGAGEYGTLMIYVTPYLLLMCLLGLVLSVPVSGRITRYAPVRYALAVVFLFLCIMNLAASSYNPFIYFRF